MKLLSKSFSTKEKILIGLLAVMLLGLVYYRLFYVNISKAIASTRADESSLQSELDFAQMKLSQIDKMEKDMVDLSDTPKMGSYNNSKTETIFLHNVFTGTTDYSISFDKVTRNKNQIRRNFSLQYRVKSYNEAMRILTELTTGEYRCLISDMSCRVDDNGTTTVNLLGTFYETMVGGTPDSALPKDEADVNEPVTLEDFE